MERFTNFLRFRPIEILSPLRKKFLVIPHVCMSVLVGLALIFDETVRQASAIMQIFDWLSPNIMAVGFLIAAAAGLYTLITASWRTFFTTNILVFALSMSWFLSLLVVKYITHTPAVPISIASIGIWAFIITDCIVIALINNKVIRTRAKL